VRSNAFTVVSHGKVATLDGRELGRRQLEALIDRTEDRNGDGAPEVRIKYFRYEPPSLRRR